MSTKTENGVLIRPIFGWFFNNREYAEHKPNWHDKRLAVYCAKFNKSGYLFITYPLGGMKRCFWIPDTNQEVPPIHLPDLQMELPFWQKHVNCLISSWIDPDSENQWLAEISSEHFQKELDYANYLGINSVVLELKRPNSPKLAALIKKHLTSNDQPPYFWILLPTNSKELIECGDDENIWVVWRNFRTLCGNSYRLLVGLTFTEDLGDEFQNCSTLAKWHAEPLIVTIIDSFLFCSNHASKLLLPRKHLELLNLLIQSRRQHISISSSKYMLNGFQEKLFHDTIYNQIDFNRDSYFNDLFDELQLPLEPLSNNLVSSVYHTFEQDRTKYDNYQAAIKYAIMDLIEKGVGEITLMVLGAGRGPIVTAAINAGKAITNEGGGEKSSKKFKLNIYAVEKNPNAILSLEYCKEEFWSKSVQIINSDMRNLSTHLVDGLFPRPDIIVSELLGSFGDNELCPECLDGVNDILKSDTICIPQSYENYIIPIQSLRLNQNLTNYQDKVHTEESKRKIIDSFYVVFLSQFCFLDQPKKCFDFFHPNRSGNSNSRQAELKFTIKSNSELMGFSGHFQTVLYKNMVLSTHPSKHTPNLHSWFPVLFPLRELVYFDKSTDITFCIARKVDDQKCWYEWQIKFRGDNGEIVTKELQNSNGESHHMKLF